MSLSVHIYQIRDDSVSGKELLEYLTEILPSLNIDLRPEFFTAFLRGRDEDIAIELAKAKVVDPAKDFVENEPLPGEVEYERRLFAGAPSGGILYDAVRLSRIYASIMPSEERKLGNIHIILTDRLIASYDEDDLRYHARAIHCSRPSIISITGIIEAPGKPREYYVLKQNKGNNAIAVDELKKTFKGQFIDYGDSRLTEVTKGYVMQAILYHLIGNPFCERKKCRLFNAHWQKEMIDAQLSKPEFCPKHQMVLSGMTDKL